jgi:hypothetical protein
LGLERRQPRPAPNKHRFEAYCFAVVTVLFVFARLCVGWRVRRAEGRPLGSAAAKIAGWWAVPAGRDGDAA